MRVRFLPPMLFRYSRIPARTIDNWTFIAFSPGPRTGPGDLPCGAARAPGKTPGRDPGNRPRGRNALGTSPAVGQRLGHLIWDEDVGGSSPSSWTRRPQDACYRPSGRHRRALRRNSAPHPAQGTGRPWLNRRERLPTKQEGAGSSPAGRAVSEAEVGDAPGRGPGGSGFEPRRTPSPRRSAAYDGERRTRSARRPGPGGRSPYVTNAVPAALAQLGEAPGLGPGGSGFESLGPHRLTDTEITDLTARGRAHWKGGGTT